jgi:hypothetical protein
MKNKTPIKHVPTKNKQKKKIKVRTFFETKHQTQERHKKNEQKLMSLR